MGSDSDKTVPVGYWQPTKRNFRLNLARTVYSLSGVAIGLLCGIWWAVWKTSSIVIVGAAGVGTAEGFQMVFYCVEGLLLGGVFAGILGTFLWNLSKNRRQLAGGILAAILLLMFFAYLGFGFHQDPIITAINGLEAENAYNVNMYPDELVAAGPRAVPKLTEAIQSDPRPVVRRRAIEVLGRIGRDARAAVPLLLNITNDKNPDLVDKAIGALSRINATIAVGTNNLAPLVEKQYRSGKVKPGVRARLLLEFHMPAEILKPAYEEVFKFGDDEECTRATNDILRIKGSKDELSKAILNRIQRREIDSFNLRPLLYMLGFLDTPPSKVVPVLVDKLKSQDQRTCILVCDVLEDYGAAARNAIPALEELSIHGRGDKGSKDFSRVQEMARKALRTIQADLMEKHRGSEKK